MKLPDSALPRCVVGDHPTQERDIRLFEVRGFEKPRTKGGANQIIERQRTGRVVCFEHLYSFRNGQETLF